MDAEADLSLALLRLLVKIHEFGTVSRAADAIGLSQPAASLALRRLRGRLGDPLFVRSGNRMLPTPRCDQIVATTRTVLALVDENILRTTQFDPHTTRRDFRVALYDVGEMVFLPKLLAALSGQAPHCNVRSESVRAQDLPQAMESAQVELAVGLYPSLERPNIHTQRLFDEGFMILARRNHPQIHAGRITLAQFLALSHVVVEPLGRSHRLFESLLLERGLMRRVVLSTPHFMSLPEIVASTDLIATVPAKLAHHFQQFGQLQALAPPLTPPQYSVKQYWHARMHNDPGLQWLRRMIFRLFNA